MRRTKIVATLGPATDGQERVRALIHAGVDVVRLNFSHGTYDDHAGRTATVRAVAAEAGRAVAILQDLQGPKIRTGSLPGDAPVALVDGAPFTLTSRDTPGDAACVSTSYPTLPREVRPGDRILISDGLLELRVVRTTDQDVLTEVVHGGMLRSRQGINLPGVRLVCPSLTEKDRADLQFGLQLGVDLIALSFVRRPQDVLDLKQAIAEAGRDVPVIAKLEKPEALDVLDGILEVADGVMVARGDLGVEMSPEQVPMVQKQIIAMANRKAKPVITATQMLESMIHNPQPTRAEASDVANAILDGSDAVMLSGETSIGAFPVQAVQMMARIAETVESQSPGADRTVSPYLFAEAGSMQLAIAAAASALVLALPVRAICVVTKTGHSARLVSHFRPNLPILAFTPQEDTYQRLSLMWGILPIKGAYATNEQDYYDQVERAVLRLGLAAPGDQVVVTGGHPIAQGGPTNFIKVVTLGESPEA
jgi:pyruvate kinase